MTNHPKVSYNDSLPSVLVTSIARVALALGRGESARRTREVQLCSNGKEPSE